MVHGVAESQTGRSTSTLRALSREEPMLRLPPCLSWKNSDYLPDDRLPAPLHWLP